MNKIKIKFTTEGNKTKPKENLGSIINKLKDIDPKEISYFDLIKIIKEGNNFILAEYQEDAKGISKDLIKGIPGLALDIDSKENKIECQEMIKIIFKDLGVYPIISYFTFSDKNGTRFRLIYRFEKLITDQEYQLIYKGLIAKYGKWIDSQTINSNRAWIGTNQSVAYFKKDNTMNETVREKIISFIPKEEYKPKKYAKKISKPINFDNDILNKLFIKTEYKDEVCDFLCNSINILDFIVHHFGEDFKDMGNYYIGACSVHGGDNKSALAIYKDTNTYSCYTHCGSGNIITLAKKIYNTNNFSSIVIQLATEYGLEIKDKYIGVKKGGAFNG